jgi:poly(3-hydroxybutyrate) depolymerase
MNPDRHAVNHYDYFKNLVKGEDSSTEAHRKFYDEYNAVLDMDAHYYLETIQTVFQEFRLVHGTWDVRSPEGRLERVRPQDIHQGALLTIEGELDDISGAGQTRAAHDLCTGLPSREQRHIEVKGAGHYGIFSGRRWRESVYPQVRDFIREHQAAHSDASAAATAPAATASPTKAKQSKPAAPQVQVKPAAPAATRPARSSTPKASKPTPGADPAKSREAAPVAKEAIAAPATRWAGAEAPAALAQAATAAAAEKAPAKKSPRSTKVA